MRLPGRHVGMALLAILLTARSVSAAEDPLRAALEEARSGSTSSVSAPVTGLSAAIQSANPDMSVVFDTLIYGDNSSNGMESLWSNMDGFSPARAPGGEPDGISVREVELYLSSTVDPYFKAYTTIVLNTEGILLEEAVIQTTSLPWGFQLKGGKFLANFSRINGLHPHDWDFADAPLFAALVYGGAINEMGLQLTWLAPTPFYLLLGAEFLRGDNPNAFARLGREHSPGVLADRGPSPQLATQWVKFSPGLRGNHEAQIGLFHGIGRHQAEWLDPPDNRAWMDGFSQFFGGDFVYKYDAPLPYGQGNFVLQGEYTIRRSILDVKGFKADPLPSGSTGTTMQDGLYLQALYGFAPRWRMGLRWDHVGFINTVTWPGDSQGSFPDSLRITAMVDFSPTEFSRLRLQGARSDLRVEGNREEVYQVMLQAQFSLGVHGAHTF